MAGKQERPLSRLEAQAEKDEQRAEAIARWTRFLRVSYYATGGRDWLDQPEHMRPLEP